MRIISLHSIKGGTGKSFLSQFMAYLCASEWKKKAIIVDLDFSGPTLQFFGDPATDADRQQRDGPLRAFPMLFEDLVDLLRLASSAKAPDYSMDPDPFTVEDHYPFTVRTRPRKDRDTYRHWDELRERCLREVKLFSCENSVWQLRLPHRPEFLRRAGNLTSSPVGSDSLLFRDWLDHLLKSLETDFDIVLLDNAPGVAATAHVMNAVWSRGASNRVGLVCSHRLSDVVHSAYELLWVQGQMPFTVPGTANASRVWWIGNTWDRDDRDLKAIIEDDFDQLRQEHPQAAGAPLLAGFTEEDEKRICAILREVCHRGRVITTKVPFVDNLRRLFDVQDAAPPKPEAEELAQVLKAVRRLFSEDWDKAMSSTSDSCS